MRAPLRSVSETALPRLCRRIVSGVLLVLAAADCSPVYAPPVRGIQAGAPGRVREGDVEIGATMAGVLAPTAGSLHVAYGLYDWLSLEGGGTFIVSPAGSSPLPYSVMGWVGPRFTLPRKPNGVSLLLDGELGIGAGVGGELCPTDPSTNKTVCEPDGLRWYQRTAFGGYQGGGLGLAVSWFSFYGRVRVEESTATDIPVTFWPSATLGLGFDLGRHVSLDLGGGYLGYRNAKDQEDGWVYQVGFSGRFGTAR
jgi:hypothetical protein